MTRHREITAGVGLDRDLRRPRRQRARRPYGPAILLLCVTSLSATVPQELEPGRASTTPPGPNAPPQRLRLSAYCR